MKNSEKLKKWFDDERKNGLIDVKFTLQLLEEGADIEKISGEILDMLNAPTVIDDIDGNQRVDISIFESIEVMKYNHFKKIGFKELFTKNIQEIADAAFAIALVSFMNLCANNPNEHVSMLAYKGMVDNTPTNCVIGAFMNDAELKKYDVNSTLTPSIYWVLLPEYKEHVYKVAFLNDIQKVGDLIFTKHKNYTIQNVFATIKKEILYFYKTRRLNANNIKILLDFYDVHLAA